MSIVMSKDRFLLSLSFVLLGTVLATTSFGRLLQQQSDDIPPIKVSYRGFSRATSQIAQNYVEAEVQVSLKGGASEFRVPIAVTFIVDGSESQLSDGADDRVREALNYIAFNLVDTDFIGLTIYDYQGRDELSLSRIGLGDVVDNFTRSVSSYKPSGGTNLFEGLEVGLNQQSTLDVKGQIIQAIVLFSDGDTNTGVVEDRQILDLIRGVVKDVDEGRPIATYIISAGLKFQDLLLEDIADINKGAFYTIANTEEIQKAYGLIFGGLLTTYYNDIEIDIDPSAGVQVEEVRSANLKQTGTKVGYTDLISDERKDITYSFRIFGNETTETADIFSLGKVSVSYANNGKLSGAKSQKIFDLNIENTTQSSEFKDPIIELQNTQQNFGVALEEVRTDLLKSDFAKAGQLLESVDQQIQEYKSGGLLDQLQISPDFLLVEDGVSTSETRRKLLQDTDNEANQVAYYNALYLFLECAVSNARSAISEISGNPESLEVQKITYGLINGLSNTLTLQRLQLLRDLNCPGGVSAEDLFANDAQVNGINQQPQALQELPNPPYVDNSEPVPPADPEPVVPEDVPEEPIDTPTEVPEDVPEDIPEDPVDASIEVPEDVPEDIPEDPVDAPIEVPEDVPEDIPEDPVDAPIEVPEDVPEVPADASIEPVVPKVASPIPSPTPIISSSPTPTPELASTPIPLIGELTPTPPPPPTPPSPSPPSPLPPTPPSPSPPSPLPPTPPSPSPPSPPPPTSPSPSPPPSTPPSPSPLSPLPPTPPSPPPPSPPSPSPPTPPSPPPPSPPSRSPPPPPFLTPPTPPSPPPPLSPSPPQNVFGLELYGKSAEEKYPKRQSKIINDTQIDYYACFNATINQDGSLDCNTVPYTLDVQLTFSVFGNRGQANFFTNATVYAAGQEVGAGFRGRGSIEPNITDASTYIIALGTDLSGIATVTSQGYTDEGNAGAYASAEGADYMGLNVKARADDNAPDYAYARSRTLGENANASVYAFTPETSYGFKATADGVDIYVNISDGQVSSNSQSVGGNVTAGFESVTQKSQASGQGQGDVVQMSLTTDEDSTTVTTTATGGSNTDSAVSTANPTPAPTPTPTPTPTPSPLPQPSPAAPPPNSPSPVLN